MRIIHCERGEKSQWQNFDSDIFCKNCDTESSSGAEQCNMRCVEHRCLHLLSKQMRSMRVMAKMIPVIRHSEFTSMFVRRMGNGTAKFDLVIMHFELTLMTVREEGHADAPGHVDASKCGAPDDCAVEVREVRIACGTGVVVAVAKTQSSVSTDVWKDCRSPRRPRRGFAQAAWPSHPLANSWQSCQGSVIPIGGQIVDYCVQLVRYVSAVWGMRGSGGTGRDEFGHSKIQIGQTLCISAEPDTNADAAAACKAADDTAAECGIVGHIAFNCHAIGLTTGERRAADFSAAGARGVSWTLAPCAAIIVFGSWRSETGASETKSQAEELEVLVTVNEILKKATGAALDQEYFLQASKFSSCTEVRATRVSRGPAYLIALRPASTRRMGARISVLPRDAGDLEGRGVVCPRGFPGLTSGPLGIL